MAPQGLRELTGHWAMALPFPELNTEPLWVSKHLVGLTPTPNTPISVTSWSGLFILSPSPKNMYFGSLPVPIQIVNLTQGQHPALS